MTYEIIIEKPVIKFLQRHQDIVTRFFEKTSIMEMDPFSRELDISKLAGQEQRYRLRIGKYRFLFRIQKNAVIIYFYDADSR